MQVRLFGGLAVLRDGRELDLGRPKQRLLFAVLAIEAGRVVATERLIELLWTDGDAKRRAALQAYVSNLRRVLGSGHAPGTAPDVLVRRAPGYRLDIDAAHVDVARFEQLVAEGRRQAADGRHDAALHALEGAIAMWRGDPLPEFANEPFVVGATTRWRGLLALTVEEAADIRLRRGDAMGAVGLIEPVLGDFPQRERLHVLAALGLYRAGRQADALRVLATARDALRDGAGLDPLDDLRRLEEQILLQSDELRWVPHRAEPPRPSAGVGTSASPPPVLHGRETELAAFGEVVDRALAGRGGVVAVTGPAGAGKTALIEGAVHTAEATGAVVSWARCPEQASCPPYWPLSHLAASLWDAGVFVAPIRLDDDGPRGDPFLVAQLWAAALRAATGPVVVVIDDLQWADMDTLRVLTHLFVELARSPALLVVACRPLVAGDATELVTCRAELARERVLELDVGPLPAGVVAAWLVERTGRADPALAAELHRRSAGNALFTRELIELVARDVGGRGSGDHDALATVPPGVRAVVRRRVSHLPAATQQLLSIASVLGPPFEVGVLAAMAGSDAVQAFSDCAPAVAAGLLVADDELGRLRFSHALVAEALAAELDVDRRAELHAAAAYALARLHPDDDSAGSVARHALAGALAGTAALAATAAARAARAAVGRSAYADAAGYWRIAVEALTHNGPGARSARAAALVELARSHERADQMAAAHVAVSDALTLARELGDVDAVGAAAAVLSHASIFPNRAYGEVDRQLVDLLQRSLDALAGKDEVARANLLAALATELTYSEDVERRDRASLDALEVARASGRPDLLARSLHARTFALKRPADAAARRAVAVELAALAAGHELGDDVLLLAHLQIALTDFGLGQLDRAMAGLTTCASLVERPVGDALRSQTSFLRGHVELVRGATALARTHADAAYELFRRSRPAEAEQYRVGQLLMFGHDLDGVEELVMAMPARLPGGAYALMVQLYVVIILFDVGQAAEARRRIPHPRGTLIERPLDHTTVFLDVAAGIVAAETNDVVAASGLLARLAPMAGRWSNLGTAAGSLGFVDLTIARLHATVGDRPSAGHWYDRAVGVHEGAGTPAWLARTLLHQGRFLLDEDPQRAGECLDRAAALADTFGLAIVARQVAASRS